MVGTDSLEVDRLLTGGELRCPGCAGELRPGGHGRERGVRDEASVVVVRPRRSWCSQCLSTHVLVPASALVRRADTVAVIGHALLAKAAGAGHRGIAVLLDRPVSTVRGWLRRVIRQPVDSLQFHWQPQQLRRKHRLEQRRPIAYGT